MKLGDDNEIHKNIKKEWLVNLNRGSEFSLFRLCNCWPQFLSIIKTQSI